MVAPTLVAKNVFFRWWSRLRGQLMTLPIKMYLGGGLVWAAIPKGTVMVGIRILGIRAFLGWVRVVKIGAQKLARIRFRSLVVCSGFLEKSRMLVQGTVIF